MRPNELEEMMALLSGKGYDPEFAIKLQEEDMGPFELEERLKDRKRFEMNYHVPAITRASENRVPGRPTAGSDASEAPGLKERRR